MEPKSCALVAGNRAAGLLERGEDDLGCLRFKMALALQLAQLIDAGTCRFFSCMRPGVEQWAAAMVAEFARTRPQVSLTAVLPDQTPPPAGAEQCREIVYRKSRCSCLAWMAMNTDVVLVLAGGGEAERRELPVWLQPKILCMEGQEFGF